MGGFGRPAFLRAIGLRRSAPTEGYPFDLPALRDLDVRCAPVTVLVGENGSGKSTLIEAIAVAAGFNAEGGGRNLRFETHATHSDLHRHIELRWRQRPSWGWFLRAETFYGMASHIAADTGPDGIAGMFPDLHDRSHGESFLALIESRFSTPGLYLLDEPESALSFRGQLALLRAMRDGVAAGHQFVMATHSPILMRAHGAVVYELDDHGMEAVDYDDLAAVRTWRRFLGDPESVLATLYDDDPEDS